MNNIILIGMPGSGKSTTGPLFAAKYGMGFMDTDTVIEKRENMPPKDIVSCLGLEKFLEIQEKAILDIDVKNHVIATGGSVIYSEKSMEHLGKNGTVIYLKLDIKELEKRISLSRRLARGMDQSFEELYNERAPLYSKYADITVCCTGRDENAIIDEIALLMEQ